MDESADIIAKNLMALQQLLTVVSLLNEINEMNTEFTNDLLPTCTEQFLTDCGDQFNAIALRIGAA